MANISIGVSREDRDGRMLVAVFVFAREVGLKRIVATTQEPKRAPTSPASVFAQSGEIGRAACKPPAFLAAPSLAEDTRGGVIFSNKLNPSDGLESISHTMCFE